MVCFFSLTAGCTPDPSAPAQEPWCSSQHCMLGVTSSASMAWDSTPTIQNTTTTRSSPSIVTCAAATTFPARSKSWRNWIKRASSNGTKGMFPSLYHSFIVLYVSLYQVLSYTAQYRRDTINECNMTCGVNCFVMSFETLSWPSYLREMPCLPTWVQSVISSVLTFRPFVYTQSIFYHKINWNTFSTMKTIKSY